jgi:hypothetical protein
METTTSIMSIIKYQNPKTTIKTTIHIIKTTTTMIFKTITTNHTIYSTIILQTSPSTTQFLETQTKTHIRESTISNTENLTIGIQNNYSNAYLNSESNNCKSWIYIILSLIILTILVSFSIFVFFYFFQQKKKTKVILNPETDILNIPVINVSEFIETKTASSSQITNTDCFENIELN